MEINHVLEMLDKGIANLQLESYLKDEQIKSITKQNEELKKKIKQLEDDLDFYKPNNKEQ